MAARDKKSPPSGFGDERPRRDPRSLAEILPQLMARSGYSRVLAQDELQEAWQQAAGKLKAQSRAGTIRNGVLEVVARNSAVVQELAFQKRQILKSLSQQVENLKIKDLRFTVGPVD